MSVERAVLDRLRQRAQAVRAAGGHLGVYDGYAPADEKNKIIAADLPYLAVNTSPDYDTTTTYDSTPTRTVTEILITGVGSTPTQAKEALNAAHGALGEFLQVSSSGPRSLINREQGSQPISREDTYTRPGGRPLWYGVVRYTVTS